MEPAGEIRTAKCLRCNTSFFYDAILWREPTAPLLCVQHRTLRSFGGPAYRRNDHQQRGMIRGLFSGVQRDDSSSGPHLLRIRNKMFAIEPVLDVLCDTIAAEPGKIHVVFGPRFSGKSTILPFGIIDTPEIIDHGQMVIVEPSHDKVVKYASTLGQTYYEVYDPSRERPDILNPLCGPYLAVGYRTGGQDGSSALNLALYSTRGTFQRSLARKALGRCGCVLLSQPQREREEEGFITILDKTLEYRSRNGRFTLIVASETDDEEDLILMLGGPSQVTVHRIPPLAAV